MQDILKTLGAALREELIKDGWTPPAPAPAVPELTIRLHVRQVDVTCMGARAIGCLHGYDGVTGLPVELSFDYNKHGAALKAAFNNLAPLTLTLSR